MDHAGDRVCSSPRRLLGAVVALTVFATAFGYVEGAVVVYLREIGYPEGFRFPLKPLPPRLILTEVAREAATIFLLLGVAFACEREGYRRFAVFAFCFGVWDLAYYLVLKVILDWPSSWLDWDVLFLIPAVWTGPVLAPALVSIGLIGASLLLLSLPPGADSPLRFWDWTVEAVAGIAIIVAFLWNMPVIASDGVPTRFPWWLFWLGYLIGIGWFIRKWIRR